MLGWLDRVMRGSRFTRPEEAVLEAVAGRLPPEAAGILRRQVAAVGRVVRYLDWTEVNLHPRGGGALPDEALFPDRSDDRRLARVHLDLDGERFTAHLHLVRGAIFSIVIRPSPRPVQRRTPSVVDVELLADPMRPGPSEETGALPESYLRFVERHGAGEHLGWQVHAPGECHPIALTAGDFRVLAVRDGVTYLLAEEGSPARGIFRCEKDGEPEPLSSTFDEALGRS